ncbi:MAG: GNAT family N-acetyltransferase [Chloroflexi bacterium RBG_16_60_22]|nr:MAG: GNAT family N-acetyltransferase [Chloroflexi bacterium RBG_16_60_22]
MAQVEKAKIADVPQIHKLINEYAKNGEMLARPLSELYEDIRDFFVIREGERVVACAALHVSWSDLAEIRSVAVAGDMKKKGLGALLVEACIKEVAELGIKDIFCFTYQPDFFKRQRFIDIDKMELPRKVWTDCFRCPKFPNCDETALIYHAEETA